VATVPGTTLGVEEEFLLLDRQTALPAPRVGRLQMAADHEPRLKREEVDSELLQALVEVATPVCSSLEQVATHLTRFRHSVRAAARRVDCLLASTGGAPLMSEATVPVRVRSGTGRCARMQRSLSMSS
jgi:carboxylate-amine ligase